MNQTVSVPEALRLVERLRAAGRLKRAAEVCCRVLKVDPANVDALLHLGTIELHLGAYTGAVSSLRRAVEQRGNDSVCLYLLASAQEAANQLEPAVASYRRAAELAAGTAAVHQGLASALFKGGQLDEALTAVRRALELSTTAEARHLEAQLLQQQGDYEAALDRHRTALQAGGEVRRCQVIQAVVAWQRATTYLEIGVDTGDNLQFVHAPTKLAVDPKSPAPRVQSEVAGGRARYFEMTSDRFFAEHQDLFAHCPIDVAFVDGLHTHTQVLKDVENCLQHLAPRGVILMHDCNPTTEAMAVPAASYEEAVQLRGPGESTDWTGDVWKAVVHLRSQRDDVAAYVLDCDFGIGVVVRRPPCDKVNVPAVDQLTYSDLAKNRQQLLGLQPPSDLWKLLG